MKLTTAVIAAAVTGALAHQHALVTEQAPAPVPMFNDKTMPAISTTMLCLMNLAAQYFIVYTALAIVRTARQVTGRYQAASKLLETACSTLTYAPMLCVLFLGMRMRAIQLTQGQTEKYGLPDEHTQTAMQMASWSVLAQVLTVLVIPVFTGELGVVPVDADGNVDVEKLQAKMSKVGAICLNVVKYATMVSLYGGTLYVVYSVFTMEGPKEIWGDSVPPVSPAVTNTINLTCQFFAIYLGLAFVRTWIGLQGPGEIASKINGSLTMAAFTVNMAPMLCILFIGARMRALQIDPKNGAPQEWAQNCFYLCTYSVLFQALMVVAMPFIYPDVKCKKGDFEGDVVFEGLQGIGATVLTSLRYLAVVALYGGFTAVMYSVFVIEHPTNVALTPSLSPAMACVMTLTAQYFFIYLVLFLANTAQQFAGTGKMLVQMMENARGTIMFAPMLCMLFIGARMRALQLTKDADGVNPIGSGPQTWAQECMFLSTWSVVVQVVLVCVLSFMYPIEMDEDGNVKLNVDPKSVSPVLGYTLQGVRYASMVAMYGGSCGVLYGLASMTPETLPPYAPHTPLVPGLEIPQPPNPPTPGAF